MVNGLFWCDGVWRTDLKKSSHRLCDAIDELSHGDGVVRSQLAIKWDLLLEHFITGPLWLIVNKFRKCPPATKGHTYHNTNMCGHPLTQWCVACWVLKKNMALVINACPKWNSNSPVLVFEKDRYLQLHRFNVSSYIDRRKRWPHLLRDYCTPIHDAAVK